MKVLIDLAYLLAAVAISPVALYRMVRHNRYRIGWENRFGKITRRRPGKKCIWLHAVSVGEVNAAKTIVAGLEETFPEFEIVISTTTDTGFERANKVYGGRFAVFYFPMDFSLTMAHAFKNIRPALCLLMELEVWPNFVQIAHASNVPVVVVNGRISDKSLPKYLLVKSLMKKIFENVTLVLAQTDRYAGHFKAIGAPPAKVIVTGSLKYDTAQITDKVEGADELADQLALKNQRLWVAGATGNDEEKIILDVYKKLKDRNAFADLRLAIIPRKPERFDEVAQLIQKAGFQLTRYSEVKKKTTENTENTANSIINNQSSIINAIVLGDTMGDLRKFYSLATVIFVGRSLVPMGGSDMIEAAALAKPTIFGPHTFNFKHTVDVLTKGNGTILVRDKEELFRAVEKCLSDPGYAAQIARAGRQTIKNNQGATLKTIERIRELMAR